MCKISVNSSSSDIKLPATKIDKLAISWHYTFIQGITV